MIEVSNTVRIYEWQGKETEFINGPDLKIESHWNDNDRVVLVTPDGCKFTLVAKDLHAAITNATNSARF